MDHQIVKQVKDWANTHSNPSILINKEEDGDLDQVELQLTDVSLGTLEHVDPDGYLAPQTLLLHGQGHVLKEGEEAPLPQNVYEIPLFGTWITHAKENQLLIRTERGVYTIQRH